MDIHNCCFIRNWLAIMDIHNWIMDINDWIMDINDWIMDIYNWIMDIHNWIMDIHNSITDRGVTIRLATIRYISRYTTHDMVHDTIQNQLIYYQWKILKHCGMCHQYCYIKTVILARNSEFKINKDVHNHPCPKYLLLTNCVCKQNNKIS